jgi:hypothetical protein
MRVCTFSAIAAACAAGALFFAGSTAEAAKKTRVEYLSSQSPIFYTRRAPRSRVTVVRPRSYLDAGNEVLPGERSYQEYAIPYGYSAIGATTLGATYGWDRRPFNAPYDMGAPRGF